MKFVITAGGTAGHINPAIALAEELTDRGHSVIFAGTPNRLESRLVPESGYDFKAFKSQGFDRSRPWTLFKAAWLMYRSTGLAKKWLKEIKPDAVIGFGCYVSIAICSAAKQLKIPYFIHEQNSVMGMANKMLSENAKATCLTYDRAKTKRCNNPISVGNPVRKQIFEASAKEGRKLFNVPEKATMLLIFGGSLGAKGINNAAVSNANKLLDKYKDLYVVHITGKNNYDEIKNQLNIDDKNKDRWTLLDYSNKMGLLISAADLCVCRSGASTLSEVTALETPCLLVPFPYATENHQYYNAKTLLDEGCCLYIKDEDLATKDFEDKLFKLIEDSELRNQMKKAYKKFDAKNAAKKLADIVEDIN